jgi:hypothetical protein
MYQPELPGLGEAAAANDALAVRTPSARLSALLDQHRRLLGQVERKRLRVDRLREGLRELGIRMASRIEPIAEALRALDQEIHVLFAELLKSRRLRGQARRDVRALYEQLQDQEVLSFRPPTGRAAGDPDASAPGEPLFEPEPSELPSASRPADAPAKGALRGLFLRLARALHPDRAAASEDAQSRAEAMKAVNQAYREGDLARLVEIERLWGLSRAPASSEDDVDRRAEALERTNQGLRAQLRTLEREHRDLKRSELAWMLDRNGTPEPDALDRFARDGEEELERMGHLRDHVRAFRDGRIPLDAFLAGPAAELEVPDLALDEVLAMLAGSIDSRATGRRGQPGRRSGRRRRGRR